jgi:transcriptional regulator of heat shock response
MHIRTAQPVGSKPLVLEYRLRISPATVRLEFAALERMGLIFQPHTSAGRVPSDMGLSLLRGRNPQDAPPFAVPFAVVEQQFARRYGEVRDLLGTACQLLSQCTNYAAFAILPRRQSERVKGVHFHVLPDHRLVVMVRRTSAAAQDHPFARTCRPPPMAVGCQLAERPFAGIDFPPIALAEMGASHPARDGSASFVAGRF